MSVASWRRTIDKLEFGLERYVDSKDAFRKLAYWTAPTRLRRMPKELHPEVFHPTYRLLKMRFLWAITVGTQIVMPLAMLTVFGLFGAGFLTLLPALGVAVAADLVDRAIRVQTIKGWIDIGEITANQIVQRVNDHLALARADSIREIGEAQIDAFMTRGLSEIAGIYAVNSARLERATAVIAGLFVTAPLIFGPVGMALVGAISAIDWIGHRTFLRNRQVATDEQREKDTELRATMTRRRSLAGLMTTRRVGPEDAGIHATSEAIASSVGAAGAVQRTFAKELKKSSWKGALVAFSPVVIGALLGTVQQVAAITRPITDTFLQLSNFKSEAAAISLAYSWANMAPKILALPVDEDRTNGRLRDLNLKSGDVIVFDDVRLMRGSGISEPAHFTIPTGRYEDGRWKAGALVAMTGETGAGKSSLADAAIRLRSLHSGAIRIAGRRHDEYKLSSLRQALVSAGPGSAPLIEDVRQIKGATRKLVERACEMAAAGPQLTANILKAWDTGDVRWTNRLSSGEKLRTVMVPAFVRHLTGQASVLFLDEATTALDPPIGATIIDTLTHLKDQGLTVVVPTHDPRIVAVADHMVVVNENGGVSMGYSGRPRDMVRPGGPAHEWLKASITSPLASLYASAEGTRLEKVDLLTPAERAGAARFSEWTVANL